LPARLVTERAQAVALAQGAWEEARPKNDFAGFLPHLEKVVSLTREMAERLKTTSAYDALLDEYEPGMTEAELKRIFADLKGRLIPLLDALRGAPKRPDDSILHRDYPKEKQRAFCRRMVGDMGFDLDAGRLDESAHPFTNGTFRDVRLTTRYMEDFLQAALFGAMHEAGHGIYEQGLDPERFRDPAGQACSLGIHESQSRFWENIIGRSRPFWEFYFNPLKETFPGSLGNVSAEAFYGAVNSVKPSLIRVEADEATYNLHILVRFDIESDLLAGKVQPRELPALWNAKMKEYLGITPPDDRDGVLQDIHWSAGLIGYFPTYALGNLYAAQFREALLKEVPDLSARLAKGDLLVVKRWLNENIHRHGRLLLSNELCIKVTGEPLSAQPFIRYLKEKYAEIYGI
jgi:carboxypeptidase Taq